MHIVESSGDLEAAFGAAVALVYKHSETCPISAMSYREIERLDDAHPELPIFLVDVHAQRGLSRQLAERFTIRHESPQAILLRDGEPVWHASHYGVTVRAIEGELK